MNTELAAPLETTRWETLQRWLVMLASLVGLSLTVFGFIHTRTLESAPALNQLKHMIWLTTECAMFGIAWLIAFRAGRNSANLAMALAIVAIYLNGTLADALAAFGHEEDLLAHIVNTLTYTLGAALFIRASQRFPHAITGDRILRSATVWGRWKPTRVLLTTLLKPAVLWPVVVALALIDDLSGILWIADVSRLTIIGLGIVYFYINYRAGDAEVRRKVLWFLAWALATALVTLLRLATQAAVGPDASALVSTVLSVAVSAINSLAQLLCVAAAVFYAGAISPSLVIRKTMVFGLTTALLLFVFASLEVFLHHLIVHTMEVTDTFASSLIGGVFGLAFHPVKHYFEHLLGKVFGRSESAHG